MSCTRSMSLVSSTPSACSNSSPRAHAHDARGRQPVGLERVDVDVLGLGHARSAPAASSRITPSRSPPRPIRSGMPRRWAAASSTSMPAGSSRARSGARPWRRATSAAGARREQRERALERARRRAPAPTSVGSEAALPPTATASSSRRHVARRANAAAAAARIAARSAGDGGSVATAAGEHARADRGTTRTRSRRRPSCRSRSRSTPPPTSTTAIVPAGGVVERARRADERQPRLVLARRAPRPRRRPASRSAATSASRLAAPRIAAVATTRTCSAPAAAAARALRGDDLRDLGDRLVAGSRRARRCSRPMRVNARCCSTAREPPVRHLGDQQPRRVRPDVDAGAAHGGGAEGCHDGRR